jgi:hypothetical protein
MKLVVLVVATLLVPTHVLGTAWEPTPPATQKAIRSPMPLVVSHAPAASPGIVTVLYSHVDGVVITTLAT